MKVKVLNVLTVIEDGGMETLVSNIYEGLSETGEFELYLCSIVDSGNSFLLEKFRKLCTGIHTLKAKNKNLGLSDYLSLVVAVFRLARYISKNKIQVVNSHDFFSAFITRIACIISIFIFWYKPKRNYVTLHNIFFWLNSTHHFVNRVLSVVTDKIICVSRSVKNYSAKKDKIKETKYVVVYNGIDSRKFTPNAGMNSVYRQMLGFKKDDIIIGNIGTLSVRKGHKYLVTAFAKIMNSYPLVKLAIFGSSRGHEAEVENEVMLIVDANNAREKILFFDTRTDISNVYNMFDIYTMSSVSEGLSLAAIEAMLMERICLFSDIGPFRELVEDGKNGFLFKTKSSDDLAVKLDNIIQNYKNISNIGLAARETMLSKFDYKVMIDNYYRLYTT